MNPRKIPHITVGALGLAGVVLTAQSLPDTRDVRARAAPQEQEQPAPVFRSRVDAIELEMRVVDGDGRAITDLQTAEVEVLEDGRPQEVIAFSRVSVPIVAAIATQRSPTWFPGSTFTMSSTTAASRRPGR